MRERCGKADRLIKRLMDTLAMQRRSLTGQNYAFDPDKPLTLMPTDRIGSTIAKVIDLEEQINGYIDDLVDRKRDAIQRIRKIPDFVYQELLIARYVQLKRLEDIAEELFLSNKRIYCLHRNALHEFILYNDIMDLP